MPWMRDCAAVGLSGLQPGLIEQEARDYAVHDLQRRRHQLRLCGQQQAQRNRLWLPTSVCPPSGGGLLVASGAGTAGADAGKLPVARDWKRPSGGRHGRPLSGELMQLPMAATHRAASGRS